MEAKLFKKMNRNLRKSMRLGRKNNEENPHLFHSAPKKKAQLVEQTTNSLSSSSYQIEQIDNLSSSIDSSQSQSHQYPEMINHHDNNVNHNNTHSMFSIDHVVIKLSHDGTLILTPFYNVNKFEFSWRTTDSSKWPNHEVDYVDDQSKSWKASIQFIGTQNDAIEYLHNCNKVDDNHNLSISDPSELLQVILGELKSTEARLDVVETKLSDVMAELDNLKKTIFPATDKIDTIKSVGRHSLIVSQPQMRSAFLEGTDLKGLCSLVYSTLGFTTEQKHEEGKTCFSKLDKIEQEKLSDLIDFFIEEKKLFEQDNPDIERLPKRRKLAYQSTLMDATSTDSWSEYTTDQQDDFINQVAGTLDIATKRQRKREEPVDESILDLQLRKSVLKEKYSKKLSNKPKPHKKAKLASF